MRVCVCVYERCIRWMNWMDRWIKPWNRCIYCLLHKIIIYQNYSAHFSRSTKMSIKLIFERNERMQAMAKWIERMKTSSEFLNWQKFSLEIIIAPEAFFTLNFIPRLWLFWTYDGSKLKYLFDCLAGIISIEAHAHQV